MKDNRTFIRVPALAAALVVALLLLVGTYTVIASPAPRAAAASPGDSSSATAWSSGWVPLVAGTPRLFNHNLGGDPDDYAVEVWFRDTTPSGAGINRRVYGGLESGGSWFGAFWEHLTSNTISVHRFPNDQTADEVFVRVWVVPSAADYDSGWQNIAAGTTEVFTHGLGITATDLTVGLWFSGTVRGIHHHAFGGLAVDGPQLLLGAHWHNLTDNSVQVTRHLDDTDVEQVRVVVLQGDPPDYDSLVALGGWQFVAQDQKFTFAHNLNWNPSMMLVRAECYDPVAGGINLWLAGGNVKGWPPGGAKGANLQNLTANAVDVYRWPNDDVCPEARVRIWKRSALLYLPLVVSNYTAP